MIRDKIPKVLFKPKTEPKVFYIFVDDLKKSGYDEIVFKLRSKNEKLRS